MYHVEECVKSLHHGLGVVITAGENPRVRFNVGGDISVDGDTLQVIPGEIYDKAIRNRDEVDRWTSWRVNGYANGEPFRLVSSAESGYQFDGTTVGIGRARLPAAPCGSSE
ncbi:MAG: hypothetical protein GXP29_05895 [Planctomycetes bacterium]|nr:hypothetical protein [Planctomycetota bacterium]